MPRLGQVVHKVTHPIFKKRGFAGGRIVTDWEKIVGSEMAKYGMPERVTFPFKQKTGGTVHVVTSGPGSMIFEHQSQMILEQINTYFGYPAVEKLRFRIDYQAPVEEKVKKPRHKILPHEEQWLAEQLDDLDDSPLKTALERLGRGILENPKK